MRLFSQKPSKGIQFFHDNGIVDNSMEATAKFLLSESDRLDKTAIGDFRTG
jgi:Sec7-like guanine-nucleotide exchange factor